MTSPSTAPDLRAWLATRLSAICALDAGSIDIRERFSRYGLDSLRATSLMAELAGLLGRPLPPTLVWEYPTIEALAAYLGGETAASAPVAQPVAGVDAREPIAIVGMACRFPQAPDLDAYWRLLAGGVDAITEAPRDRWDAGALFDADPAAPGKLSTRWGGFLEQVDRFDPHFFGISPREAVQIDPQQRLTLELAWEALEDAGVPPRSLLDTRTGVFMGAMWTDYASLRGGDLGAITQHTATGQDTSIIPARVSYQLGLRGPCMVVNTACSSSLVAVHLGRQSLLSGECALAIAGGVNLLLSPESTVAMSKFGAMAPDGRSKAFDARANGYVRGEGGGVVILERLSRAIALGHPIHAILRGSAVNNDGFSNGLTAPSPKAQELVLRDACASAGVEPARVDYVEAHGTGTMLGDPIEAGALGVVFGEGRPAERPLVIGSVKTNIGHLEAAAGMAGLIKVVLAMRHRAIPASLHFERPNPHIAFEALRLRVPAALGPWPEGSGPALAGVSSFGFGGTNCHVIVEGPPGDGAALGAAAAAGAVTDAGAVADADAAADADAVAKAGRGERARPVFVFAGQGSQWRGMGRALLRDEPAFRASLARSDRVMQPYLGVSLLALLAGDDEAWLEDTALVQPAIFAVQVGLADLLRAYGIEPAAVVGQSIGEVSAALVAGCLSLEDAARILCARSRIVKWVPGGMAAVELSPEAALRAVEGREGLSVAVDNGPSSTVISGDTAALEALLAELERGGVFCRRVKIDYPSHSPRMEAVREELLAAVEGVRPRRGAVPFYSTVTGEREPGERLDAAYWWRSEREPVRFAQAMARLLEEGHEVFLDLDPHPLLNRAIEQCAAHTGRKVAALPLMRRDEEDRALLREALAALGERGAAPEKKDEPRLLALSAHSEEALAERIRSTAAFLRERPEVGLADVCYTAGARRSHLERRAAFVVEGQEEALAALEAGARGEAPAGATIAAALPAGRRGVVFVFPGQGSQWLGMGRRLLAEEPAFRAAMETCDEAIARESGFSVLEELGAGEERSRLSEIDVVQPVLFAIEVALAALWRAWGVTPDAVVGHSMGEVAAAHVAGILSLADAARVICRRSRLLRRVSGRGAMGLVELTLPEAEAALAGYEDRLSVAVSNGPRSTVLSGDPAALEEVLAALEGRGVFCRRVKVDVASHSPQMDPLLEELRALLAEIRPGPGRIPMRSTVTGEAARGEALDAGYWARNLRAPVLFSGAIEALAEEGHALFVELSPHPILVPAVEENLRGRAAEGAAIASVRRGSDERRAMREALGALWARGVEVDWEALFPAGGRVAPLPAYPWQRERCWIEAPASHGRGTYDRTRAGGHPVMGPCRTVSSAADLRLWETTLGVEQLPWVTDHRVRGAVVWPGAGYLEMALAAGAEWFAESDLLVTDVELVEALLLPGDGAVDVQVVTSAEPSGRLRFQVASQAPGAGGASWTVHARGVVQAVERAEIPTTLDVAGVRGRLSGSRGSDEALPAGAMYRALDEMGLEYGPAFQGMTSLWRGDGEALARVRLPEAAGSRAGYLIHPALLDACIQVMVGTLLDGEKRPWVPVRVGSLRLFRPPLGELWCHARLVPEEPRAPGGRRTAELRVVDGAGAMVLEISGLVLQQLSGSGRRSEEDDGYLALTWQPAPAPVPRIRAGRFLLLGEGGGLGAALRAALEAAGHAVIQAVAGAPSDLPEGIRALDDTSAEGVRALLGEAFPGQAPTAVVHLRSLEGDGASGASALDAATSRGCDSALRAVQALAGMGYRDAPRLWLITRGAQAAVTDQRSVAVEQAPLLGLARVIAMEHPELRCARVDLDPDRSEDEVQALLRELVSDEAEQEIALREGGRRVARLAHQPPAPPAPERGERAAVRHDGSYVITGGLGGLGVSVAAWLAEQGAGHLVLVGRSGAASEAQRAAVAALSAGGARVTVVQADVAERTGVERALDAANASGMPLRGVIHAAGLLDDGMLLAMDPGRLRAVMAPKAQGALHLDALTRGAPLDFFVLYASASGLLGSPGQGNYAAANTLLDALAHRRRAEGLPALSIDWGPFSEVGLAAAQENRAARLASRGMRSLTPAEGLRALDRLLGGDQAQVAVVPLDVRQWVEFYPAAASSPMLARLMAERSGRAVRAAGEAGLLDRLARAEPEARPALLHGFLRGAVSRVLHIPEARLDVNAPLTSLGMDSLIGMELRNRIEAALGLRVPATLLWTYPTVTALAGHLAEATSPVAAAAPRAVEPASDIATAPPEPREDAALEPIAVVGLACRFPGGADDPSAFWELLEEGRDAISSLDGRWDLAGARPGEDVPRWAGLLSWPVDHFDAAFFGISPREAVSLDPQHRLLLEVGWEALEDAGITPGSLHGSRTGVFVGASTTDYAELTRRRPHRDWDAYGTTGNLLSIIAGRLSYTLGLQGPCLTVDTACSSSLVAVHLACRSLRAGESDLALAGGVNLLLSPDTMEGIARTLALSPEGRCKTFDALANGFARGEGAGLVVLKRLSDARRDGDRIWALIRGSAMNQDGRSTGLTAPNVLAQEALLREALQHARVEPAELGFIETHGTGTSLGDPIEVEALRAVVGTPRPDGSTCALGAVKTNLGHLEAAAGVAGLIKAVLALHHERIPRNLHLRTLNPRLRLEGTALVLPAEPQPWPRGARPRFAGVSSFGMSGTNAHVVLEEAPASEPREPAPARGAELVTLSAKSEAALAAAAERLREHLEAHPELGLGDVAFSLATTRSHLDQRLAVAATSREELCDALAAAAQGQAPAGAARGSVEGDRVPRVVFVFPGQGSQWLGMGRMLLAEEPAFRAAMEACDEAIAREAGFSVLEELRAGEERSRLAEIDVVQPVLFAIEVALAALWRAWGVEPAAVVGHSMGEVAAAYVAGILSLADAARVICRRSRLLRRVSGKGAMGLVELTLPEAEAALAGYEDRLSVAVSNGPRSTVLSGDPAALEEVLAALEGRGVFCRRVKVDVASHSPQMDPLLEELRALLAEIRPGPGRIPMRSTVTGEVARGEALDAAYWARNLRAPVLFSGAIEALAEEGHALFVELSPHPILVPAVEENLRGRAEEGAAIASVRRGSDERRAMREALCALWARGVEVDWEALFPAGGRVVPLPAYPWQRERYWLEAPAAGAASMRSRPAAGEHPLLGAPCSSSLHPEELLWEQRAADEAAPWLADHRLGGEGIFPGSAYVEMALAAGAALHGAGAFELADMRFERMLALPCDTLQLGLVREAARASVTIASRDAGDGAWTRNARAEIRAASGLASQGEPPSEIRQRCSVLVEAAEHYARIERVGVDYGPRLRSVERLWTGDGEVIGLVRPPDELAGEASGYQIHPALLDGCLQVVMALLLSRPAGRTLVPVGFAAARLRGPLPARIWVHARGDARGAELRVLDEDGRVLLEIGGLSFAPLEGSKDPFEDCAHAVAWRRRELPERAPAGAQGAGAAPWLILRDAGGTGAALARALRERGEACVELDAAALPELPRLLPAACRGVVHCGSLDAAPWEATSPATLEGDLRRGSLAAIVLAQAILRRAYRDPPRLFLVTRGAQAVGPGPVSAAQAPLWGLARVITLEHPELECARIDLPPSPRADEVELLLRELLAGDGEEQVALRAEGRFVARLVRSRLDAPADPQAREVEPPMPPAAIVADGSYLITGGLGGLGLSLARWMVQQGARHLVLVGRSAPGEAALAAIRVMEKAGAEVRALQADVSRAADVERVVGTIREALPPLRGVVHAAAVVNDRTLLALGEEQLAATMGPKVLGAFHLHAATRGIPLDFFVMYSSLSSALGEPGQGAYAACNAFLDALAHARAREGLPATSIQWGLFADVGVAAVGDRSRRLSARGLESLTPEEGAELFGRVLERPRPELGLFRLSLHRWLEATPQATGMRYLSELPREHARPADAGAGDAGGPRGLAERLAAAGPYARASVLLDFLRAHVSRVLRIPESKLDADAPLTRLGLDSLMGMELRHKLKRDAAVDVPMSRLLTDMTITKLAGWLGDQEPQPAGAPAEPRKSGSWVEAEL